MVRCSHSVLTMTMHSSLQEAIPGSAVVVYPSVGRVPQEEGAEKSAADLKRVLEKHRLADANANP